MTSMTARTVARSAQFVVKAESANKPASRNQRYVIAKLLKDESLTMEQWEIGIESHDSESLTFGEADKTIKYLGRCIMVNSSVEQAKRQVVAHKAVKQALSDSDIAEMVRCGKLGTVAQKRLAKLA